MARAELIFGLHAVQAALRYEPDKVRAMWVERTRHDGRMQELLEQARQAGVAVRQTDRAELDRLSGGGHHQGVAARLAGLPALRTEADLTGMVAAAKGPPLLLALDGVQDPHNLGACLRSADAAGAQAVIVPADRAVSLTPTVRKVASGAAETTPLVQATNLARTLRGIKEQGVWIIGASGEAQASLYDLDFTGPVAIVLGAEDRGLRRLTRELCDYLAKIPMAGSVESLNVSVAAGVFLFEALRQRRIRIG